MTFQISALPKDEFAPLFELDAEQLKKYGAMKVTADRAPGFPCRVSLQDAAVRGFDARGMLKDADVVEGTALESLIDRMLASAEIDYLHVHFARMGCFAARVDRSSD
jgi:hypothetical protein